MSKLLIHTDSKFHNNKLNIPFDGVVQLGPNGEVQVSERAAEVLLTIPNWLDPELSTEIEDLEVETPKKIKKQSKLVFEEDDSNSTIADIDLASLDQLDTNELLEVAAMAEVKVPTAMQKNKKNLVTFLRTQLKKKLA